MLTNSRGRVRQNRDRELCRLVPLYTAGTGGGRHERHLRSSASAAANFRNPLQFGTTELGDEVALMGYPLSQHSSRIGNGDQRRGLHAFRNFAAVGRAISCRPLLAANQQTVAALCCNMRGEIVGILTFGYRDAEGVSFAVSPQTAMPAAHTLKTQTLRPRLR